KLRAVNPTDKTGKFRQFKRQRSADCLYGIEQLEDAKFLSSNKEVWVTESELDSFDHEKPRLHRRLSFERLGLPQKREAGDQTRTPEHPGPRRSNLCGDGHGRGGSEVRGGVRHFSPRVEVISG